MLDLDEYRIDEIYYTTKEIAEVLKLHVSTVQKYIKKGIIPAKKIGKNYRISKTNFQKFVKEHNNIDNKGGLNER